MDDILNLIEKKLRILDFQVVNSDWTRPWGGVLEIKEDQSTSFFNLFFPTLERERLMMDSELKPKVLVIAPGQCLSWHYHSRRTEFWKILEGPVGILISATDQEPKLKEFHPGELIIVGPEKRHKLVGLHCCGVVAEVWQHTRRNYKSDEQDLICIHQD